MKALLLLAVFAVSAFAQIPKNTGGGGATSTSTGTGTLCNGSSSTTAPTCPGIPVPTTYGTSGTGYLSGTFVAGATSTGALTLNIGSGSGLGAKTVYINGTVASASNTVTSGTLYPFFYDGTNIQLVAGGGAPSGTAGCLQLYDTSSTFGCDPTVRDLVPNSAGYYDSVPIFLAGSMYSPVVSGAVAAGNGTLSLGVHRWCVSYGDGIFNPSSGIGMNVGESLCSNIISATVTDQVTQGSQTFSWMNNSSAAWAYNNIYRSDDGINFYFDISISGALTTYTDSGDALTLGESPTSRNGTGTLTVLQGTPSIPAYFEFSAPGGSGDIEWSNSSIMAFNYGDRLEIYSGGFTALNQYTGNYLFGNPGGAGGWRISQLQDDGTFVYKGAPTSCSGQPTGAVAVILTVFTLCP